MNCRIAILGLLVFMSAFVQAAGDPKKPILLVARDAKTSSGLMRYSSTGPGGVCIGGLVDKTGYIDFELKVEPGKYRMVVSLVPLASGYLLAKIDDGLSVRRSVSRSAVYSSKPQEFRFGEIDILEGAAKLRFTGENISQPGLCYFHHVELFWVAPLPAASRAKSPLQLAAEKEKVLKEAEAAKKAQELRDNLKETTWSFCYNHNFEESRSTLVFGTDGNLGFSGSPGRSFNVVDPRTIDIFYNSTSGRAFSRLRFADDMGSFKSILEEGIRQPRSGRLLKVLGAVGEPRAQPAVAAVAPANKAPVVLALSKAKTSPGLERVSYGGIEGMFVIGWLDPKATIDYTLDVEPGRYRMVASIIPDGGGYLLARIGDSAPVRRSVPKRGQFKPQDLKMGEIEVPERGALLRFSPDNPIPPGLCLFRQVELAWVGPLETKAQVKSPTEIRAEKDKAVKAAADALAGAALVASLKGTSWSWYGSDDFSGQAYPMSFNAEGTMGLPWNRNSLIKGVDGKTIDVFYSEKAFWRLQFSDDLKSFKSDLSVGMREPKSGRRN